jgi:hypothetical protein
LYAERICRWATTFPASTEDVLFPGDSEAWHDAVDFDQQRHDRERLRQSVLPTWNAAVGLIVVDQSDTWRPASGTSCPRWRCDDGRAPVDWSDFVAYLLPRMRQHTFMVCDGDGVLLLDGATCYAVTLCATLHHVVRYSLGHARRTGTTVLMARVRQACEGLLQWLPPAAQQRSLVRLALAYLRSASAWAWAADAPPRPRRKNIALTEEAIALSLQCAPNNGSASEQHFQTEEHTHNRGVARDALHRLVKAALAAGAVAAGECLYVYANGTPVGAINVKSTTAGKALNVTPVLAKVLPHFDTSCKVALRAHAGGCCAASLPDVTTFYGRALTEVFSDPVPFTPPLARRLCLLRGLVRAASRHDAPAATRAQLELASFCVAALIDNVV